MNVHELGSMRSAKNKRKDQTSVDVEAAQSVLGEEKPLKFIRTHKHIQWRMQWNEQRAKQKE